MSLPEIAALQSKQQAEQSEGVSERLAVDTDTLFVDATNNRVGIGTDSPTVNLEVSGGAPIVRITDANAVNSAGGQLNFMDGFNKTIGRVYVAGTSVRLDGTVDALRLQTLATDRLVIDYLGNVGIGTTSPSVKLDVDSGHIRTNRNIYHNAQWCGVSGARQNKGTYWNTWWRYGWNGETPGGGVGDALLYPHTDTSLLQIDGISVNRTGHYYVVAGQRSNGTAGVNPFIGIGESGNRATLDASGARGTDGQWSHDHSGEGVGGAS